MSEFFIQVTTFFIVKLLFTFLPNEFDTIHKNNLQMACFQIVEIIFFLREKKTARIQIKIADNRKEGIIPSFLLP